MKVNKKISNPARDLIHLDIDSKKRRKLIKANYGCFEMLFEFPREFKKAIEEAKKNNLKQEEAYEYLKESTNKYDNKVASEMAFQINYRFGINNTYRL